jgi:hypothetical protein
MGNPLRVVSQWDRSSDRHSHRERCLVHGRVDELEPILKRKERGKQTDIDFCEVLGVMPLGLDRPVLVLRERHDKLTGGRCGE